MLMQATPAMGPSNQGNGTCDKEAIEPPAMAHTTVIKKRVTPT
jgi:hypothetical protein